MSSRRGGNPPPPGGSTHNPQSTRLIGGCVRWSVENRARDMHALYEMTPRTERYGKRDCIPKTIVTV